MITLFLHAVDMVESWQSARRKYRVEINNTQRPAWYIFVGKRLVRLEG